MRIVDRNLVGQCGDRADTGHGHKASADRVGRNNIQQHCVKPVISLQNRIANRQHGIDHPFEDEVGSLQQFAYSRLEFTPTDASNLQPVYTEQNSGYA
jgi:hypothetical protein